MSEGELSLTELSERAEVPPRTIRYYIAQGLLPGPLRSGRDAAYGSVHLARLARIKELQAGGMTLAQVTFALSPDGGDESRLEPVAWWEYQLADDVIVRVRGDIAPWRQRAIKSALVETRAKLQERPDQRENE